MMNSPPTIAVNAVSQSYDGGKGQSSVGADKPPMPEKPILVSKRDFLEQVLQKSHGSSFGSEELCENSLSQPRLP